MSKKINIFIPCDEANHICDKSQYNEANIWEKLKLTLHLAICKACRRYSKNNGKLTKSIKKSHVDCLTPECKEIMKKELEQALKTKEN
ncbi:hypothetical protein [Algibacter pacificus]|uniref:hypothetical protein n=1 Tax=Algibacter pacificus TaxID=2599389 RepID=UPI00164FA63F|nr:hypothetical protein [Algibacter pacificus]